jgi:hypothetical protein
MKLVSVYMTFGQLEAELMKAFLEAQGLDVEISQESVARTMGLSAGKLGEVQVLVPEDQVPSALEYIRAMEAGEYELPPSPDEEA